MRNSVLKNSLLVVILALMTVIFFVPAQAHADDGALVTETPGIVEETPSAVGEGDGEVTPENQIDVNTGIIAGAQLDGYKYSFSVDPTNYGGEEGDAYTVKVLGYAETAGIEDKGVDLSKFKKADGSYDFTGIWDMEAFKGASLICIVVEYVITDGDKEYSYKDMIVYNSIPVSEDVEEAAEKDTTFTYDVDSVSHLNIEDLVIEPGAEHQSVLNYLRTKTDILEADEDYLKNGALQWVDNTLVLKEGQKTASGNIVLALLTSQLLINAGFEPGKFYDYIYITDEETINLLSQLPVAINIKEVAINNTQYKLDNTVYGYTFKPFADIFSAELFNAENLIAYFNIFFRGSEYKGGEIVFGNLFSLVKFQNGYSPKEFAEGFSVMIHDDIAFGISMLNIGGALQTVITKGLQLIAAMDPTGYFAKVINELINKGVLDPTSINELLEAIDLEKFIDIADYIAWLYDQEKDVPLTIATMVRIANVWIAAKSLISLAVFVGAESAQGLTTATVAAFEHGVNTADANNVMLYIALLMIALAGAAGVAVKKNN